MLAVNVRAPHVLVGATAPAMAERGSGVIITIGSWMARVGSPFAAMYSATKAADEQLTRSWAAEYGPRGVRVNTVAPGATLTPGNEAARAVLDAMTVGTPAGVVVRPEDIARGVLYLASDDAVMVHGSTLAVDGGISATRLSSAARCARPRGRRSRRAARPRPHDPRQVRCRCGKVRPVDEETSWVLAGVGPRLAGLRQQRSTTLAALSRATGISVSTLSRLESGQRRATLELLLPIAKAHGVALDDLVGTRPAEDPRVRGEVVRRNGMTLWRLSRSPGQPVAYKILIPASISIRRTRARPTRATSGSTSWPGGSG